MNARCDRFCAAFCQVRHQKVKSNQRGLTVTCCRWWTIGCSTQCSSFHIYWKKICLSYHGKKNSVHFKISSHGFAGNGVSMLTTKRTAVALYRESDIVKVRKTGPRVKRADEKDAGKKWRGHRETKKKRRRRFRRRRRRRLLLGSSSRVSFSFRRPDLDRLCQLLWETIGADRGAPRLWRPADTALNSSRWTHRFRRTEPSERQKKKHTQPHNKRVPKRHVKK